MAKINVPQKKNPIVTHEGGRANHINDELRLKMSIMACLLWENTFYENGIDIADRIKTLVPKVKPEKVAAMAITAREEMKLRHVPLLLVREMARYQDYKGFVKDTLSRVIQRADELAEFLAIYWKDGKEPIASSVKKGLAQAFTKFNRYQLGKYNRDGAIKLRDVLFLSHACPLNKEQAKDWSDLVNGTLESPDTWEVNLSAGGDKKSTFERLLKENKLGGLALLRNLRNMKNSGVDEKLIITALKEMKTERILPYRFIAAAGYAKPSWEAAIEDAMFRCLAGKEKIPGKTILLVDVSGSMNWVLGGKTEMKRTDVANGLAVLARELCEDIAIYSFSNLVMEVPSRRGFALSEAIKNSQPSCGTHLGKAVTIVQQKEKNADRIIVITDEQSHDAVPNPIGIGTVINVATYQNGVGYGKWNHIDGWSEAVLDYIQQYEREFV